MIRSKCHIVLILTGLLAGSMSRGQNIGIGTTTPQATLDLRGNNRIGGLNSFLTYDSISGKISWNNSYLYAPTNAQFIQHSASAEGLFYNNSALEYWNHLGQPVFSTNWNSGTGYFRGNLGIGVPNPIAKLHVQNGISGVPLFPGTLISESSTNNYLSFYTPDAYQSALLFEKPSHVQSGGIYYNNPTNLDGIIFKANNSQRMFIGSNGYLGIGTFPASALHVLDGSAVTPFHFGGITLERNGTAYVNIVTPNIYESGYLFGNPNNIAAGGIIYNNSATPNGMQFRTNGNITRMVLTADGRLGIGNLNPGYVLDVSGRIRLRMSDASTSAGIWLNDNTNINVPAFLGMQDDTHVGLYGKFSGWGFTMNTITGALRIDGAEGAANQVLISRGSGDGPEWKSLTKFIYDNTVIIIQNADLTLSGAPTPIPNLTHTFTVPGNAKAVISMDLNANSIGCDFCGSSRVIVDIQLNGNFVTEFYRDIGNNHNKDFRAEYVIPLTAGTHTIRLVAAATGTPIKLMGSTTFQSSMIIEVIPEMN